MSNNRSNLRSRHSDLEILASDENVALLRAVAAGRVTLDWGSGATLLVPDAAADDSFVLEVRELAADDLVALVPGAGPMLTGRGRRLLEIANGEIAAPLEQGP